MIAAVVNFNCGFKYIEFMEYFVARISFYVYGSSLAPRPLNLSC